MADIDKVDKFLSEQRKLKINYHNFVILEEMIIVKIVLEN